MRRKKLPPVFVLTAVAYSNGDVYADSKVFESMESAREEMKRQYDSLMYSLGIRPGGDTDDNGIDEDSAWILNGCESKNDWRICKQEILP